MPLEKYSKLLYKSTPKPLRRPTLRPSVDRDLHLDVDREVFRSFVFTDDAGFLFFFRLLGRADKKAGNTGATQLTDAHAA